MDVVVEYSTSMVMASVLHRDSDVEYQAWVYERVFAVIERYSSHAVSMAMANEDGIYSHLMDRLAKETRRICPRV